MLLYIFIYIIMFWFCIGSLLAVKNMKEHHGPQVAFLNVWTQECSADIELEQL